MGTVRVTSRLNKFIFFINGNFYSFDFLFYFHFFKIVKYFPEMRKTVLFWPDVVPGRRSQTLSGQDYLTGNQLADRLIGLQVSRMEAGVLILQTKVGFPWKLNENVSTWIKNELVYICMYLVYNMLAKCLMSIV